MPYPPRRRYSVAPGNLPVSGTAHAELVLGRAATVCLLLQVVGIVVLTPLRQTCAFFAHMRVFLLRGGHHGLTCKSIDTVNK